MNNILHVKLPFNSETNLSHIGPRNLRKQKKTTSKKLEKLKEDLSYILSYYQDKDLIENVLVDVCYDDVIAKSNRIKEVLKEKKDANDSIVGARFTDDDESKAKHIITYYVSRETIRKTISKLETAIRILNECFHGEVDAINFEYKDDSTDYEIYKVSKTAMRDVIIDCSVIEGFSVPRVKEEDSQGNRLITFYQTEASISELLFKLGIERPKNLFDYIDRYTISADKETYEEIMEKAPYLVSMVVSDFSSIIKDNLKSKDGKTFSIPSPKNEPTIGVIDTVLDQDVYFSKWVEYHEELNEYEKYSVHREYSHHGTVVDSLIIDGPRLNPWLDDGCGRFRVRHFGVCESQIGMSQLIQKISRIIDENQDIHVWNLSMGTKEEVSRNFMSYDGAKLDEIQREKNVLFVIAGTNKDEDEDESIQKRIGSPADSLDAIVVNSVKRDGESASYTRIGKVLSFYNKPDVSYYGGDYQNEERITVYTKNGTDKQYGTSYAAPWIARKACYLIDVMGFSREVAKALILDSAAGWNYRSMERGYRNTIGFGIVPIRIKDVLSSDDSEIRFILSGKSMSYLTSNYAIPVPKDGDEKCSYLGRAMLCYFPRCDRLQGVDYTQRELSVSFGRMVERNGKMSLIDLNQNIQDDDTSYCTERNARSDYRKWDNTKFISEELKERCRGRKFTGRWGLKIVSKDRNRVSSKENLNFGMVITLKNMKNQNRIEEFKHLCLLRGYIVNEVNIENNIELYDSLQEEVRFED